ncbi:MAG: thymidine kinase [Clostridia bacterium]
MAKLYFRYSPMGAGKSIDLLKVAYNYEERGLGVILFTAKLDNRYGVGKIHTRIGLSRDAYTFDADINLFDVVQNKCRPACVLVDEAQFLSTKHVDQLSDIVDFLDIPVICYGLRADFRNELFEGSKRLFTIADKIEELKTICDCGKKAVMNMRLLDGKIVTIGEQILIGDAEYKSVCRKCYKEKIANDFKKDVNV